MVSCKFFPWRPLLSWQPTVFVQRHNWLQAHNSVKCWNATAKLYSVAMGQMPHSTERFFSFKFFIMAKFFKDLNPHICKYWYILCCMHGANSDLCETANWGPIEISKPITLDANWFNLKTKKTWNPKKPKTHRIGLLEKNCFIATRVMRMCFVCCSWRLVCGLYPGWAADW